MKPIGASCVSRRTGYRRQFLPAGEVEEVQTIRGVYGQDPAVTDDGVENGFSGQPGRPAKGAQLLPQGHSGQRELASLDTGPDQSVVQVEAAAELVLRGQQQSARDGVP